LRIGVRINKKLTTKCWVGFIDWLDPRVTNTLSVFVKTITGNRLTATARARLQIATQLVKSATSNTTVVALGKAEVIFSFAIRNAIILLRVDNEMWRVIAASILAVPSWLLRLPRH
jgi:hypothetical protein